MLSNDCDTNARNMKWWYRIRASLLAMAAFLLVPASGGAQLQLNSEDARKATALFDTKAAASLKCNLEQWQPALDFSFRFVAGFAVSCPLGIFSGKQATITNYVRITPEGKSPILLGMVGEIPEIPPDMLRFAGGDASKIKNPVGTSGVFDLGEGTYSIEALAVDDQGRVCRRRWKVRVGTSREQSRMALAIAPLTVQVLDRDAWQIDSLRHDKGLHLTIMLNAVPINQYQSTLRAWDRTFLLEFVHTVLRKVPYKSVRLIAFNLDQQREIYRADRFDNSAFVALSHALRQTETATVSVQALKQRNSPKFLLGLTNRETARNDSSTAILWARRAG